MYDIYIIISIVTKDIAVTLVLQYWGVTYYEKFDHIELMHRIISMHWFITEKRSFSIHDSIGSLSLWLSNICEYLQTIQFTMNNRPQITKIALHPIITSSREVEFGSSLNGMHMVSHFPREVVGALLGVVAKRVRFTPDAWCGWFEKAGARGHSRG